MKKKALLDLEIVARGGALSKAEQIELWTELVELRDRYTRLEAVRRWMRRTLERFEIGLVLDQEKGKTPDLRYLIGTARSLKWAVDPSNPKLGRKSEETPGVLPQGAADVVQGVQPVPADAGGG